MSSTERLVAAALAVLLGIATVLYSFLIVQQLLVGAGVAFAFFVAAAFLYQGSADRQTVVRATVVLTVAYGVFTFQLPAALVAACVVYLTAWATGPESPFDAPDTRIFPATRWNDRRNSGDGDGSGDADGAGGRGEAAE
ncbi:hypothetical protein [Halocalculus aciditolerans]|uniref:Uncharacterized protein n=1 Tax=Halocalculus aciditolerans TaxID=1383812 RepID=A0A830FB38_9EURY|nr:hypothetical protein [Halocalculus aciditolerans]GGL56896.1 hypothetical protein GCM10009039_13800 [Halocalculus aciditolerans]